MLLKTRVKEGKTIFFLETGQILNSISAVSIDGVVYTAYIYNGETCITLQDRKKYKISSLIAKGYEIQYVS